MYTINPAKWLRAYHPKRCGWEMSLTPQTCKLARELLSRIALEEPDLLPAASRILRVMQPCRHGIDFASVVWFGASYAFTGNQAAVVKLLWRAWENGTPCVRDETLTSAADRDETLTAAADRDDGARLGDLFRGHPAWGTMIVPGQMKGTHRLAEPQTDHSLDTE